MVGKGLRSSRQNRHIGSHRSKFRDRIGFVCICSSQLKSSLAVGKGGGGVDRDVAV
jgi:hypothetical protein